LWGGLGASLIYLYSSPTDSVGHHNYSESTYWEIFLAGLLGDVFFALRSQKMLLKAINTYNGINETTAHNSRLRFDFLRVDSPRSENNFAPGLAYNLSF